MELIIYGAGGHAKVVIDAWLAAGGKVEAVFDDYRQGDKVLRHTISGRYRQDLYKDVPVVVAIGDNKVRKDIASKIERFGRVVHPESVVSSYAQLGDGTVVMAGAIVNADAVIGRHVIVNTSASIDHDCHLHDYVHIGPHSGLCGGVTVGEGALVGAGVTVIPGITIGKWATIGAGSVIVEDVPDYAVVKGVPGRVARIHKVDGIE